MRRADYRSAIVGAVEIILVAGLGTDIVGGAIGGLVVAAVIFSLPWLSHKFGRFEARYLDPHETITPEHMRKSICLGLPTGDSMVALSLHPRDGIILNRWNFAFFDNPGYPRRLWPPTLGRRRSIQEVRVTSLKGHLHGTWFEYSVEALNEEAVAVDQIGWPFYENSRAVFEIGFRASEALKDWDGILRLQLHYSHGEIMAMRNVHTKVFVRPLSKRRPITFALRNVQRSIVDSH